MARLSALLLLSVPSLAAAFLPPSPPSFSRCLAAKPCTSKMPLRAAKSFTVTDEDLGAPVELQRAWFQQFGFAEPGPPPKKSDKAPAKGAKAKPQKTGGFGAQASKLECVAPSRELVTVLRADLDDASPLSNEDLAELGAAARRTIEENLPRTGAVLLRNLPMRSADDFAAFWAGCKEEAPALEEGRYISLGPSHGRDRMSGIDLATNVPPQFLLLCHNELCYNPQTVGRIALYCIQDAKVRRFGMTTRVRFYDLKGGMKRL